MSAPTDHVAAARAALDAAERTFVDDARGTGTATALRLAYAQVHATLALAEETRTANLLAALDYNIGHAAPDERRTEIVKRLWATP